MTSSINNLNPHKFEEFNQFQIPTSQPQITTSQPQITTIQPQIVSNQPQIVSNNNSGTNEVVIETIYDLVKEGIGIEGNSCLPDRKVYLIEIKNKFNSPGQTIVITPQTSYIFDQNNPPVIQFTVEQSYILTTISITEIVNGEIKTHFLGQTGKPGHLSCRVTFCQSYLGNVENLNEGGRQLKDLIEKTIDCVNFRIDAKWYNPLIIYTYVPNHTIMDHYKSIFSTVSEVVKNLTIGIRV